MAERPTPAPHGEPEARDRAPEERLAPVVAQVARAFRELSERMDDLDRRLEETPARLADALGAIRDAVADLAESQALAEKRLAELGSSLEERPDVERIVGEAVTAGLGTLREDQARHTAALQHGLGRVDALSAIIESLDQRRGFRRLEEAEREWGERQEALTGQLTGAADVLADRLSRLEAEVDRLLTALDPAGLADRVGERVESAVGELRQRVGRELGTRVTKGMSAVGEETAARVSEAAVGRLDEVREQLAADVERVSAEATERAVAAVREEVADIRAKVTSWGRLRTAPRLAEELKTIEGRVEEVEGIVQGDLVEAVFERMQRAFDRSFEALVQLVETRVREAVGRARADEHERRGLFRRGRDEG